MKNYRKKILFVGIGLGGAGAQRQLVNIITSLNPAKYDIYILIRENDTRFLKSQEKEFKIFSLYEPGEIKSHWVMTIKEFITLLKVIRENKIDIVYARGYPFYWKAGIVKKIDNNGFKLISVEATYISEALKSRSRFRRWIVKWLLKVAILQSDLTYCLTESSKESLVNTLNVPSSKVNVFPVVFNSEEFQNIAINKDHFNENYFNILSIGRFVPLKNHLFLIDSFQKLSNKNDRLYIIGEGNLQEEYEKRIRQLGLVEKVFIEKFSSEPYSLIKGSALVVFPSNYEGFGNVLLESIFCETPIIATDFKGIDRQIRDLLFDNGLLVELGNIDDMASKINYVRDNYDVAKNATINIKKIISDRFSLEKNIALLEAEFDKI